MANKTPITHSFYTNEIPTRCQMCAHKVKDENRWICEKHPEGKFVGTIGYSCFTWSKNSSNGLNYKSDIKPKNGE